MCPRWRGRRRRWAGRRRACWRGARGSAARGAASSPPRPPPGQVCTGYTIEIEKDFSVWHHLVRGGGRVGLLHLQVRVDRQRALLLQAPGHLHLLRGGRRGQVAGGLHLDSEYNLEVIF